MAEKIERTGYDDEWYDWTDFARQLERELAAARRDGDLVKKLSSLHGQLSDISAALDAIEDMAYSVYGEPNAAPRADAEPAHINDLAVTGSKKFSDFIRNATPEEKQAVYSGVMRSAAERQNNIHESVTKKRDISAEVIQGLEEIRRGDVNLKSFAACNACNGLGYIQATDGLGQKLKYQCKCSGA